MAVEKYLHQFHVNLLFGSISIIVALGGGFIGAFPGWLTAAQGVVAGMFLTLAALQYITGRRRAAPVSSPTDRR